MLSFIREVSDDEEKGLCKRERCRAVECWNGLSKEVVEFSCCKSFKLYNVDPLKLTVFLEQPLTLCMWLS